MTNLRERLQDGLPERYTIEREIGRGGMAYVYLARERHPQRAVAIKALRPEVSAALGSERFIREIDIVSKLTHPHIVPVFAAGDAAGILFYVMPYVEGETLRDRMLREGTIDSPSAVQIARDVAAALDYAHRRDIVHRDVKPENILLHADSALVADFGVARAVSAAGDDRRTDVGIVVGTAAYMSPEQARGEATTDARSDIFALGCVLFEMLAGAPPAGRGPPEAILHRQASTPAPPLRERAPGVPAAVAAVVDRALARRPDDRFQTAGDFAAELDGLRVLWTPSAAIRAAPPRRSRVAWLTATVAGILALVALFTRTPRDTVSGADGFDLPPYRDSVVVIPVTNRTGNPALDRLSDAITYEAIARLQTIATLKVPSYLSVASQEAVTSPAALADLFGVRLILAGALRETASGVQLAADLVQGQRNATVRHGAWSIAGGAAQDTAQLLAGHLVELILAETGLARPAPEPARAHSAAEDPYRLGQEMLGRRTATAVRLAIQAFRDALTLDSAYAPSYAGLSRAYALALFYRYEIGVGEYEAAGRALASAERAVAIDPRAAGSWQARGYIRSRAFGPDAGATADFARALALAPNDAQAGAWSALLLQRRGQSSRAMEITLKAIGLDPFSPARHLSLAYLGLQAGRYDLVLEGARRAAELEPSIAETQALVARALLLEGRAPECLGLDLGPHVVLYASCLVAAGRHAEGARVADSVAALIRSGNWSNPTYTRVIPLEDLATYHAIAGDLDAALAWTAMAFEASPLGVDRRVLESRLFDRLHADPAAAAALQTITDAVWPRVLDAARAAGSSGRP